jgi:outer membrane biosynthesis protein TonB
MIRGYRVKTQSFESADPPAAREYSADEKKGEAGRLQILSVTVSKGLSRDKFSYALQKQLGETGKCAAGMKISGQVVVHLTIHPDGTVKTAKLGGRHIKDRVFRQCILDQVKGWFFEAVADGKEAQATVVFKAG